MTGPLEDAEWLEDALAEARDVLQQVVDQAAEHDAGRGGCVCPLCALAEKARAILPQPTERSRT